MSALPPKSGHQPRTLKYPPSATTGRSASQQNSVRFNFRHHLLLKMTERREKFEKTTPCRWEIPRSTTCGHRVTPMNLSSGAGAGASRASSSPGWRWLRSHVGSMLAAAPARSRRRSWQQPPRVRCSASIPRRGSSSYTPPHSRFPRQVRGRRRPGPAGRGRLLRCCGCWLSAEFRA